MKETNDGKTNTWKGPLKGWRWLAAWAVLAACLTALAWMVLALTTDKFYGASTGLFCLLSMGISLAAIILLGLLVRCLSSWRNFKRLVLGLICLAGLIALFYAEEDIRGRLAWGEFKAQWEAKGEKFNFAAFIPPAISDDRNFAMTPVVAGSYGQVLDRNGRRLSPPDTNVVDRLGMPLYARDGGPTNGIGNWQKAIRSNLEAWQRYYRNLALATNLFPVAPQPQTPAADVLLALSKYDSTIEELRQAAALPASRFPLNYDSENPAAIFLTHLAPAKGCAAVLRLRALAELEAGQSEKALADVGLALRLIETLRPEPFFISHLVRIAMFQITEQALWEGLAAHRWTDAQLSQLDQPLAALDFVADYQAAMRAENAFQAAMIDFVRHAPGKLGVLGDIGEGEPFNLPDLACRFMPSGWFYQNELRNSKFILERFLPVADARQQTISPALAKQADKSLGAMRLTPYTFLGRMFLPGLANGARRFAFAQTAVNLARTASALDRHRLARGKYPETLAVLAPQFIAKVPRDPVCGQPLHYRPTDGGRFILYSVGWNETDDGGTVSLAKGGSVDPDAPLTKSGPVDLDNGDWVWQYPNLERKPL
ncbi:MAG: hypothetical protein ACLQM8_20560 [Limisphaerales bacterium]